MRTLPSFSAPLLLAALLAAALLLAACDASDPAASAAPPVTAGPAAARGQGPPRCVNVAHRGEAALGFPVVIPLPGQTLIGGGGLPTPVDFGPFQGLFSSILLSEERSGNGAVHYELVHYFEEGGTGDAFWTSDRAVCAPAGGGPLVCRVNDVMTVVGGTGKFGDASGSLRNHGLITITVPDMSVSPFGTLGVDVRGRICGDGV